MQFEPTLGIPNHFRGSDDVTLSIKLKSVKLLPLVVTVVGTFLNWRKIETYRYFSYALLELHSRMYNQLLTRPRVSFRIKFQLLWLMSFDE